MRKPGTLSTADTKSACRTPRGFGQAALRNGVSRTVCEGSPEDSGAADGTWWEGEGGTTGRAYLP